MQADLVVFAGSHLVFGCLMRAPLGEADVSWTATRSLAAADTGAAAGVAGAAAADVDDVGGAVVGGGAAAAELQKLQELPIPPPPRRPAPDLLCHPGYL